MNFEDCSPLDKTIILDLTRFMSGPYATMLLADAGARVIKVEPPAGEETRWLQPMLKDGDSEEVSGYYLRLNRRKESVCLDLRSKEGKEAFLALVKKADVVVENYRPGVMDRLGIGADALMAINPRLIYCCISGFGRTDGPSRDWPAFNIVAEGMAGVLSKSVSADQAPQAVGPAIGDLYASMDAVAGVLMALLRREKTGKGSVVDIAMYDAMLSLNEYAIGVASMTGRDMIYGQRVNPNLAPYGYFPTRDGWVCIAVGPDRQWLALCDCMRAKELHDDARLATGPDRAKHFAALIEPPLLKWLGTMTRDEAAELLARAGVPASPVRNASETLRCPQVLARGMLVDVNTPNGATWKVVGSPIHISPRFDLKPPSTTRPGADTQRVFSELTELSAEAIQAVMPQERSFSDAN